VALQQAATNYEFWFRSEHLPIHPPGC